MNPNSNKVVLGCIAAATRELPDSVVEAVAAALEAMPGAPLSEHRIEALIDATPGSAHRLQLKLLFRCATKSGLDLPPLAIAWAMRAAAVQDNFHRARLRVDLVWSGPETKVLKPRRTDQALIEVIDRSERELIIATFAAYKVPAVKQALKRAIARRVRIKLILEFAATSGGKVTFDPLKALEISEHRGIEVYVWPHEKRPTDEAGHCGSLHIKCAIADDKLVLISSANLTEFAFELNMELGVLIRGAAFGQTLSSHFREMIEEGILQRL